MNLVPGDLIPSSCLHGWLKVCAAQTDKTDTNMHKTKHLHNKNDSTAERSEKGELTLKFMGMQRISVKAISKQKNRAGRLSF